MQVRRLGWAGVEIEAGGATVVIDALRDPNATFAPLGATPGEVELPELVEPAAGRAVAALVTHLHRDHTDAAAIADALAPDAPVYEPAASGGSDLENAALAQADAELRAAGVERRPMTPWQSATVDGFTVTALPAVDGLGDPQVSWLVEADGVRVLHLGDTVFHGYWWRMVQRHGPFDVVFLPINGARVEFPHRRPASPLPVALEPEQAALAGELLGARTVVPMHYGGFAIEPFYRPVERAEERFLAAAAGRPYEPAVLAVGEAHGM
jgi:L-ascorbate metabolism protein UlaG (beta-lactamase superfamily)